MRDLVDLNSNEVRKQEEVEVPFLKGAYVVFWTDVTGSFVEDYEKKQKELEAEELTYWVVSQAVADWNFADSKKNKIEISEDSIARLSPKLRIWIINRAMGVVFPVGGKDEKKESPSS